MGVPRRLTIQKTRAHKYGAQIYRDFRGHAANCLDEQILGAIELPCRLLNKINADRGLETENYTQYLLSANHVS